MTPFELSTKIKTTVTPNQIHKMMDKLKSEIFKHSIKCENDFTTFSISKAVATTTPEKEILSYLQGEFLDRYRYKKLTLEYQIDLLAFKEELFQFNVSNDISKKLSLIESNKLLVKYYSLFEECTICSKNHIEAIKRVSEYYKYNEETSNSESISLEFYDSNEAKSKLKELKQNMLLLEQEITQINGTGKIEVEIYSSTAEFLGLG